MRLAILLRFAIPFLLALVSATVFFRMLLLFVLALAFAGFLFFLVFRITGNRTGKVGQTPREGPNVIDGRYRIVDENEEPHK